MKPPSILRASGRWPTPFGIAGRTMKAATRAPGIGLGFRRLSIIDVKGGHQPLFNEDGTDLDRIQRRNLQFRGTESALSCRRGHSFKTRSDTETIVHLYEELGEECFAQLRGMFAIASVGRPAQATAAGAGSDREEAAVLFRGMAGGWCSARRSKRFGKPAGVSKEFDVEAFSDYFSYQYVPAPKTIYKNVRKLRPGHYLVVEGSNIREVPYWDIHFDEQSGSVRRSEWCEAFLAEYRTAVKSRLISDVPLGAFLSAGVDSSSVVALMNEIQSPVTTCSIGFTEQRYDEATDARQFANTLGANHFEHIVKPKALDLLPKLAWHYDEPFADSSAVPTYYVSQVARQHVTVALSGDGGDESFAGYRRYKLDMRENLLRSMVPAPVRQAVFGPLGQVVSEAGLGAAGIPRQEHVSRAWRDRRSKAISTGSRFVRRR